MTATSTRKIVILGHLAGAAVFTDEDFAEYELDNSTISDLRTRATRWYDDLAGLADNELERLGAGSLVT